MPEYMCLKREESQKRCSRCLWDMGGVDREQATPSFFMKTDLEKASPLPLKTLLCCFVLF